MKKRWNNWWVFLVSIAVALIGTPLAAPLYGELFYVGGGFFLPSSYDANTMTFLLLYTFFFPLIYLALGENPRSITAVQFLSIPALLFIFTWDGRLIAWIILLAAGLISGWLISKFIPNIAKQ